MTVGLMQFITCVMLLMFIENLGPSFSIPVRWYHAIPVLKQGTLKQREGKSSAYTVLTHSMVSRIMA